jgi:hypothetical protein
MALPIGSPNSLLRKMADKLAEVRREPTPETTAFTMTMPKPSLFDKLKAAGEKVKAQEAHNNNLPPRNRGERE